MEFQVGDTVVGNSSNFFHRIGMLGKVERINEHRIWVTWEDGDTMSERKCGLTPVSRAAPQEPTPPRKMHPDDFMQAVGEFAEDNGFGVTQLDFFSKEFVGSALPQHSYSV